jgi:hypothetical protein
MIYVEQLQYTSRKTTPHRFSRLDFSSKQRILASVHQHVHIQGDHPMEYALFALPIHDGKSAVILAEQDRSLWDRRYMEEGLQLAR